MIEFIYSVMSLCKCNVSLVLRHTAPLYVSTGFPFVLSVPLFRLTADRFAVVNEFIIISSLIGAKVTNKLINEAILRDLL